MRQHDGIDLAKFELSGFEYPYLFLDQAWIWNEDRVGAVVRSAELTSIGAGLRANLDDRFRFDVAVAVPLDRIGLFAERPDARLLISLTARLWPWTR